jgi:hypothetical protein
MAVKRLDRRINLENPGLSQQRLDAKRQMTPQPNRGFRFVNRLEGPPDGVPADRLLRLFALGLLSLASAANAQTLASIKALRHLDCGTVQSVEDWNGEDIHGDLSALGGEICRAVAVAILGDPDGLPYTSSLPSRRPWPR